MLATFGVRQAIYRTTDPSHDDTSPLPGKKHDAPFITSPDTVVQAMVDLAAIGKDDLVYDLGCGDGRIVIAAAERTGCRGVGIDKDPQRIVEAQGNAKSTASTNWSSSWSRTSSTSTFAKRTLS